MKRLATLLTARKVKDQFLSRKRRSCGWVTLLFAALLACVPVHAATYYVGSTGSDSNTTMQAQSISTPWLTLGHALGIMACGDTIKIVANGSVVNGNGTLPSFPGCVLTSTIESSALASFLPGGSAPGKADGWRTNPTRDAAFYGRLEVSTSIQASSEAHGSNFNGGTSYLCAVIGLTTDTFTMFCNGFGIPSGFLANGSQIEFEVNSEGHTLATAPTGFSLFTKYYVVSCSSSPACGTNGSTFKIATTSGGTPLSGFSCTGWTIGTVGCTIDAILFTVPLQVTVGSSNIVMGDLPVNWAVNTPIAISAVGFQDFGTLPAPLVKDTPYYITSIVSKTIQVSATLGGSPIVITSNGTSHLQATNTDVPHDWAFRGLELVDPVSTYAFGFMTLGSGSASDVIGVVNHIEVDRNFIHSQNNGGETRGIAENGAYNYIHDNYFSGFSAAEAQPIAGWASPGPTWITDNFLEGAGQCTLYGGNTTMAGTTNANKIFQGNECYKPPTWLLTENNGVASGPCYYDATDPDRVGGQWYSDVGPLSFDTNSRPPGGGFAVDGGGGSGAILQAVMTAGVITSLNVIRPGTGYASNFSVNDSILAVATGSGFSATVTVAGGVVTGATIISGGSGFTPTNGTTVRYRCNSSGMWATTGSTYPGYGGPSIKPGFEHKNGSHFTYAGNLINYNFAQAQSGQAWNNNQEYGSGPGFKNDYITLQDNAAYNVFQFVVRGTACGVTLQLPCLAGASNHTTINNLIVTNPLSCGVSFANAGHACGSPSNQNDTLGGDGTNPSVLAPQYTGETYRHNTQFAPDSGWPINFPNPMYASTPLISGACASTPTMNGGTNSDNIVAGDYTGDSCTNATIIQKFFTNYVFSHNLLLHGTSGNYSSPGGTNTWVSMGYPAANSNIGFVGADGTINGDYHLATTSPYSASCASGCAFTATDGTDVGADIDRVMWKTSGARVGGPDWDVRENFTITPLSTGATISFDRPGASACSLTIYDHQARISANEDADTNTSGKKLDTRTGNTVVSAHVTFNVGFNSALTPNTQYWYKLSCVAADMSTWLLAGDSFTTLPTAPLSSRRSGAARNFGGAR